ncbi:acyl carrier protein [Myxococcota bacterium]|nr:acyl carrier protein [Myxococcota bacterium]
MDAERRKIYEVVVQNIAEALGLDEEEVHLEDTLIEDLGAESLDFLDIAFRLEQDLGIKIPRGDIQARAAESAGDEPFEVDGVLTAVGLARLREAMPEIPDERFKEGMTVREIPYLFTVETFFNLCVRLVGEKSAVTA